MIIQMIGDLNSLFAKVWRDELRLGKKIKETTTTGSTDRI
jgi:hypothetical protein